MGVENDNNNRVIRKLPLAASLKTFLNFSSSPHRGGHEPFHQLERPRAAEGDETSAEAKAHRAPPQLHGESLLEGSI